MLSIPKTDSNGLITLEPPKDGIGKIAVKTISNILKILLGPTIKETTC